MRRVFRIGSPLLVLLLFTTVIYGGSRYRQSKETRQALYDAFEPVKVTNCELQRFGDAHDGGYLLCANWLPGAQVAYSYGINGADNWGCQVSKALNIPVHQYDCFNTSVPGCAKDAIFHAECVGPERATIENRPFDSVANQVAKNGDAGKRIVMKMDVEGSEWASLLASPDDVLDRIDQMAVEFHEVENPAFLATIERLKRFFHVAHVHVNNYNCDAGFDPFPGQVFEALLVNKRLAQIDPSIRGRNLSPLDAPNLPERPDCQASPGGSELARIGRWTRRIARAWSERQYNDWKDRLLPPY
ncbi:MAG TPA: hypothetical protein VFZ31_09850 [Vicinamibacterales bacterium]